MKNKNLYPISKHCYIFEKRVNLLTFLNLFTRAIQPCYFAYITHLNYNEEMI